MASDQDLPHVDSDDDPGPTELAFLRDGGELGALIRKHDWSKTSIFDARDRLNSRR